MEGFMCSFKGRIKRDTTGWEMPGLMFDGLPGVAIICRELIKLDAKISSDMPLKQFESICHLDDLHCYGEDIAILSKMCDDNLEKMIYFLRIYNGNSDDLKNILDKEDKKKIESYLETKYKIPDDGIVRSLWQKIILKLKLLVNK